MNAPASRYVERLVGLPQALDVLTLHPDGLPLSDLAAELGVRPEALRETVLAYYLVDFVGFGADMYHQPVVEFVGPEGEPDDPLLAPVLRAVSPRPERELGVDYLAAGELAALYEAGRDLLELKPDNDQLRSALESLRQSLLPIEPERREPYGSDFARQLADAASARRKVRITYARSWHPGMAERVIDPYRLIRTRRGWEVDSGPPHEDGTLRTFLVSGIRSATVLDERFERPADVDALIAADRRVTPVEVFVPQSARWAVDRFAEHVEVLQEDESVLSLRADLLPPVDRRVGLVLITAGPDAFVVTPAALADAGARLARELLQHYGLSAH